MRSMVEFAALLVNYNTCSSIRPNVDLNVLKIKLIESVISK